MKSISDFRPNAADFGSAAGMGPPDGDSDSLGNLVFKSEARWRVYFTIHLLVVVATAIVMTHETASSTPRGTWRDIVLPLGPALLPAACIGAPLALVTPVAALFFLAQAPQRGWDAIRAAIVAALLTAIHHFALLPTVQ